MKDEDRISRRDFHRRVGAGMLWAGLGPSLACELGLSTALAEDTDAPPRLIFGDLEPLVGFMQDTPLDRLQASVVEKLNTRQVSLEKLMQAAALANARSFGGDDYVGMHTLMAMTPAWLMAQQLPPERRALIVLKILHRNTGQIRKKGTKHLLHEVEPVTLPTNQRGADALREAVHGEKFAKAEQILATLAERSPEEAFNDLMHVVAEDTGVHRIVFAHRSWEILDLAGMENAKTMLRQSLRHCLRGERHRAEHHTTPQTLVPKLLDKYNLLDSERPPKARAADDAWVDSFSQAVFAGKAEGAAEAVAEALADGIDPHHVGEAISLATNQLVLRDAGRQQAQPGKPEGSVHGDSIGVHASDSANSWRGIAEVSNRRNATVCLILAGYQAARDRTSRGGNFLEWEPRPSESDRAKVTAKDPGTLLPELDRAIKEQDQRRACALVDRYAATGGKPRPVIEVLLRYATSVDGALHAEKYFLTATSDFAATRPKFQWRHLVGLARVTASEAGQTSAGYEEACKLLKVQA